ncbi:twitching motility protein PilT [Nitrosomonas sp.]|uniref:twitching motility protein PilT n=1 Tax=Nitrosomonas sp. TaxID=42353 RepID=UPI0025CDDFB7|nr:twitching motility protein PilT [Nitrosomonas sp.]
MCRKSSRLMQKGDSHRKTNNVIIATYCIEHQLPLFYADQDFDPFTDYFGLIPVY